MKRIILSITLISILMTEYANAQLSISAGGGANFSNVSIKNIESLRPNTATNFFISVRPEFGLTDKLNVGLDIQFSRKGYNNEVSNNQDISGYRFQYLDLIPQVQYKIIKQLAIYGGLGIAIQTSEKYNIGEVWKESVNKLSKSSDFNYVAGLRIFPVEKLGVHIQYASSLTSITDLVFVDDQGQIITDTKILLNNLQIGITYKIF